PLPAFRSASHSARCREKGRRCSAENVHVLFSVRNMFFSARERRQPLPLVLLKSPKTRRPTVKSFSTILVGAALGASMLALASAAIAASGTLGLSAQGPRHHSRGQLALGSGRPLRVSRARR